MPSNVDFERHDFTLDEYETLVQLAELMGDPYAKFLKSKAVIQVDVFGAGGLRVCLGIKK